uniref:Uncharacterized protein n=1 Tax=Amphora coffeiformis TaxID=265554 RepID=A0A7S3L3E5_9STRA
MASSNPNTNGEASREQPQCEESSTGMMIRRHTPAISKRLFWKFCGVYCQNCHPTSKSENDPEDKESLRVMDYNLQALAASSPASPLVLAPMLQASAQHHSTVELVLSEYIASCRFYGSTPNAGILSCLRFALPCLRTADQFRDTDMLALGEVLLRHCNGPLRYIKRLDFTVSGKQPKQTGQVSGLRSHGAVALAKVLQMSEHLTEVRLQRNTVGPYGASAIFLACAHNRTLHTLGMRQCRVGERGALVLAETLSASPDECGLRFVDLSANFIGHVGCEVVDQAVMKMNTNAGAVILTVDLEGNLVFQEIMNAVTHGLGVILAFVGSFLMSRRVADKDSRHVISCAVYNTSLIVLYTSSTLYHSFFSLQNTKYIFEVLDKCAIYILIAGSYTPFLTIVLGHEPIWSYGLLGFIWACCVFGIGVDASFPVWRYRNVFSLAMYVGMGWCCCICLPEVASLLPENAIRLMILGGVAYTTGIPFYLRSNNLDHAIWHLFVLAGSIFHWLGIYLYVAAWDGSKLEAIANTSQ